MLTISTFTNPQGKLRYYGVDPDNGFDGTAQGWGYKSEDALKRAYYACKLPKKRQPKNSYNWYQ